jgi:hypothetical protein
MHFPLMIIPPILSGKRSLRPLASTVPAREGQRTDVFSYMMSAQVGEAREVLSTVLVGAHKVLIREGAEGD